MIPPLCAQHRPSPPPLQRFAIKTRFPAPAITPLSPAPPAASIVVAGGTVAGERSIPTLNQKPFFPQRHANGGHCRGCPTLFLSQKSESFGHPSASFGGTRLGGGNLMDTFGLELDLPQRLMTDVSNFPSFSLVKQTANLNSAIHACESRQRRRNIRGLSEPRVKKTKSILKSRTPLEELALIW